MSEHSALDVAKWFIWRNKLEEENGSERMTLLKLIKLLYYAEGCSLALNNKSLFDEPIIAWEHGPVVEEVYQKYKKDPYNLPLDEEDYKISEKFNKEDLECLEQVFNVFGAYSAWGLRNKTHSETPWIEATNNGQILNQPISRDTMKEFFKKNYIES